MTFEILLHFQSSLALQTMQGGGAKHLFLGCPKVDLSSNLGLLWGEGGGKSENSEARKGNGLSGMQITKCLQLTFTSVSLVEENRTTGIFPE